MAVRTPRGTTEAISSLRSLAQEADSLGLKYFSVECSIYVGEALVNNKVPAAILDPPYTTMAAKEGFKLIVDLTPLDVPYLRNIVAVSEKSLREEPRMISKFVEALSEGIVFYRNNANKEENIRILAKYLRVPLDKNRAMVERTYDRRRIRKSTPAQ